MGLGEMGGHPNFTPIRFKMTERHQEQQEEEQQQQDE